MQIVHNELTHPGQDAVRVVRAQSRERADVLALLAKHLNGADVASRYAWLYEQNPHGRAITVIAYDGSSGEPMGLTSVFPRRVCVDGTVRLGSMGGDGYVRPTYRRRGVATLLHRAAEAAMREDGVEFMFGPPEPHNLRALVRAGARIVTRVTRYVRPAAIQYVLRTMTKLTRSIRLDPVAGEDPRVAAAWARSIDDSGIVAVRDPAQYAWRFGAHTPRGVEHGFVLLDGTEPIGLCALERRGSFAAIVDLLAPPDRYAECARAVAAACDAQTVSLQLTAESPAAAELWRAGFVARESKPFQVFAPAGFEASLVDARRWYYTWGDGDIDQVL